MADNKVLQTRIKLKIDTLENWQKTGVWDTFIPLAGEKILFQIPSGDPETTKENGITPPQVISKTGNGVIGANGVVTGTVLRDLPWDSALAADVAAWAKPGDTVNYVNVPDLKKKVDELEDNLVPDHKTLTINGIAYDPVGALDVALTLAANTGLKLTEENNTITITGKVAGSELGMVKSGGNVTVNVDGTMTADGVDEADHADKADYADEAGKVTNSLVIKGNGTAVEDFNGENAGEVNIKPGKGITITTKDGEITIASSVDNALHFIGVSTTEIKDEGTQTPTISGWNGPLVAGDVVLYGENEFVWDGSKWEELGEASSFATAIEDIRDIEIDAGAELTWSGSLGSTPKIDHDVKLEGGYTPTAIVSSTVTTGEDKTIKIPKLTVNKYGHVTAAEEVDLGIKILPLTIDDAEKAATAKDTTLVGGVAIDAGKNEIIVQKKTVKTNKTASALEVTGDEDEIKIGFKNQNQTANDILFGDETWAGGTSANYVIFDCGTSEINI